MGALGDKLRQRVLTLDIETAPAITAIFDLKVRNGYISPANMLEPGRVMCVAAKWLDRPTMIFLGENQPGGHDEMVRKAWQLVNDADIIVTFNGKRFDLKHLRKEFLLAGLPPTRPHKDVDLYQVAKSKFEFESKSLNHLSMRLGIGQKVQHEGLPLWLGCMNGDRSSWATMRRYCCADVQLTEDVYMRTRNYIHTHPHVGQFGEHGLICNVCGSSKLKRDGTYMATVIEYQCYRCECGALVRAGHERRVATTRGIA